MPKQTGSKSYTDIELCLIFKEIIYLLPYKKSEWENIYEPCKRAVEMYNKTHRDQLIIRKAKAIARKFEDMTYSSKKIATNEIGNDNNYNTYTQLCHIATQIKALCKINYLFKEGQKNYNLNKIVIKRRKRILQSINSIERNYYDKKYNEDLENNSSSSENENSPLMLNSKSAVDSINGLIETQDLKGNENISLDGSSEKQRFKENGNDALQKMEDIKYIKSVMKDIKDNVCEVNEKDDYDKIIEQSLTTMKTISKILNDAIIFCNMIANRSKKVEDNIEDDFSDDVSVFSDNEDTYTNSKDTIDKSLNDAFRIINEDEKSSETIFDKSFSNDYINDIENDYSLSNIQQNKKRKYMKDPKFKNNSIPDKKAINNSSVDNKMIKISNSVNNSLNNSNINNNFNSNINNNNNINSINNINNINHSITPNINHNVNGNININNNLNNHPNSNINNTINYNYNNLDARNSTNNINNNNNTIIYEQKPTNLKNPNTIINPGKDVMYNNASPGNTGYNIQQKNEYYYNSGNSNSPNSYNNNNNVTGQVNNGNNVPNFYNQNYINNYNSNNSSPISNVSNNNTNNINPASNLNNNSISNNYNNNNNNNYNYNIIYNNKNTNNNNTANNINGMNTGYIPNNNIIYNNMNTYSNNNHANNNFANTNMNNSYFTNN